MKKKMQETQRIKMTEEVIKEFSDYLLSRREGDKFEMLDMAFNIYLSLLRNTYPITDNFDADARVECLNEISKIIACVLGIKVAYNIRPIDEVVKEINLNKIHNC